MDFYHLFKNISYKECVSKQLDDPFSESESDDYDTEDDMDFSLPKRKTKKVKIEDCCDKNTKAVFETVFDIIKRKKTKRAAKKNIRNQSHNNKC